MDPPCTPQSSLESEFFSLLSFGRKLLLLYQIFLLFTEVELSPSLVQLVGMLWLLFLMWDIKHTLNTFFFFFLNQINKQSFFWIYCIALWDAWKTFEWVNLHYTDPSKYLTLNGETNYMYLAFILWLYFCQMNKQAHVLHPKGNIWLIVPNNQGEMMHIFFVGR